MCESEWINVKDALPDVLGCTLKVKRENGEELKCVYYRDQMIWLRWCGIKTSHFMYENTNKFLFDVTHWLKINNISEECDK